MNKQETGGVLAVLSATWPHFELTDETANVWASQLTRVLVQDALTAAAELARHSTFFPSLADFIKASQSAARRRAADAAHEGRQLPSDNSPHVTDEEGLEAIRAVRETAARAAKPQPVQGMTSVGQTITKEFTR